MSPVPMTPVSFTPLRGLMAVADRIACSLERKFHFQVWHGADGLRGVVQQKLTEVGVPETPITLVGNPGLTLRAFAEQSGFIRPKKRMRRVK